LILSKPVHREPCLSLFRILLAIDIHFDYKSWQMDVKTAFLNIHLDEDIYMMQSSG
jgi:hypothetical protein